MVEAVSAGACPNKFEKRRDSGNEMLTWRHCDAAMGTGPRFKKWEKWDGLWLTPPRSADLICFYAARTKNTSANDWKRCRRLGPKRFCLECPRVVLWAFEPKERRMSWAEDFDSATGLRSNSPQGVSLEQSFAHFSPAGGVQG
jgi:hypothetical protein